MDYERKYKLALERAKKLYEQGTITESLGYVFPELAESKDERIRKAIKKALQVRCGGSRIISDEPVTLEEALAWLEKQGENKPAENVEIKFCEGDKVIEWMCHNTEYFWNSPYTPNGFINQFKKDFGL